MATSESRNLDNIQGDIWPGLLKKYQIFWFFRISDASAFKPTLAKLVDDNIITSSADAVKHRQDILEHKKSKPGTLRELAAVNISFSRNGMKKLSMDINGFRDFPFVSGMEVEMVERGRDRIEEWEPEFTTEKGGVDGVVLVCGTEPEVKKTTTELAKKYFSSTQGINHVLTLDGRERPEPNEGHEHFGFLDAISQPRLTGFDETYKKGDGNYQHMCRPGRIIIGHDGEMNNDPDSQHPPWAKDGSYLVVRKLKQLVPEFNDYLEKNAPDLHFTPDQLGARMVGRWKSGAPVEKHPDKDCPDDARLNNFNYDVNSQRNCPFASHIRKTKPRSIVSDRDMNDMMRRGIPYGPEVGINETETEQDRGLMFTCYQSSIGNGFQFVKNQWINLDTFPADKTQFTGGTNPGQDVIVGQTVKMPQSQEDTELTTSLVDGKGQNNKTSFTPFIRSNGGEYFFSPSLQLLRDMSGVAGKPSTGKRKREDSCSEGNTILYQGKFNYSSYVENENIWVVFPEDQRHGAPIWILTTFTRNEAGTDKKAFNGIFPFMAVDAGKRTFTTRVDENSNLSNYYWFDGGWSENGTTVDLKMLTKNGEFCAKTSLSRAASDTHFKN